MTESDDLEGAIAAHGPKSSRLVLQLSEYEGQRILNIRRWYVNKDGEWRPTRKGITVTQDAFEFILRAFKGKEENIREWLEGAPSVISATVRSNAAQAQAATNAAYSARPVEKASSEWKSPAFFKLEGHGASDRVVLNATHPVAGVFDHAKIDRDVVCAMLAAFERARALVDGGDDAVANALDLIAVNWGLVLKRYMDAEKR